MAQKPQIQQPEPLVQPWLALGGVDEAIATVIGDHYGLYGRSLPPSTDLMRDLGSDDVDFMEVVMTLEELFNVRLNASIATTSVTIEAVMELVHESLEDLELFERKDVAQ